MAVNYRELTVYKKARELVVGIDRLIKAFPATPQARVIASQMFDSATSIGANIAEGKGKNVGKEYLRYLTHAQGSANETDHWLHTVLDCSLAKEAQVAPLLTLLLEILKILSSARVTLSQQIEAARPRLREQATPYVAQSDMRSEAFLAEWAGPEIQSTENIEFNWGLSVDWLDPLEADNP